MREIVHERVFKIIILIMSKVFHYKGNLDPLKSSFNKLCAYLYVTILYNIICFFLYLNYKAVSSLIIFRWTRKVILFQCSFKYFNSFNDGYRCLISVVCVSSSLHQGAGFLLFLFLLHIVPLGFLHLKTLSKVEGLRITVPFVPYAYVLLYSRL